MSITIGIGKNLKITPTPTPEPEGWDADFLTYISGLVTPISEAEQLLLNTFIVDLKAGLGITNLSDAFDIMYILANETQELALRNVVKRAHDATAVNAPAFVAFEGYTGNGSTQYINTNYNPGTDAINLSLNNASIGVYQRTNLAFIGNAGHLAMYSAVSNSYLHIYQSNTAFYYRINSSQYETALHGGSVSGMTILSRQDNLNLLFSRNGAPYTSSAKSSNFIPNHADGLYILARNNNGVADLFNSNQISFAFAGEFLTDSEQQSLTTIFEAYMDANGKGVIP